MDKRITDSHLMFVQINEASKVIPLPYIQPLFLDVPTVSDVTDSKKPRLPQAFRAFRLHRVIYTEGSTLITQLIVGDDLNTSLQAMYADLEATAAELMRDMDIVAQNSTALPSKNHAIGVALHRFTDLVRLKLALPLAQVDVAREDMERFLHHRLEELHSQTDMKSLIDSLSQRIATHQSRVHQIVYGEPMENIEVLLWVILGVAVDQPVESNFFPGILEELLGRLGITAPGEKNPPTSAKEGVARLWASAVLNAVQKMEKRQVRLETSGSSGMPSGLHLNYEEDFLNYQSHQVPGVFTDPLFLPNMVNSVYKLVMPPVLSGAPPFAAAQDRPTIPLESGDDRDSAMPPSPSPSTVGAPTAEKSKAGLPTTPIQIIGKSDTESDKTENLEPEVDSSYSAQVFPPKSDHALRKWTRGKTDSVRDSKDGAPSPKRATIKKEMEGDDNESSSSTGLSDETLHDHRFMVYGRDSTAVHEVRAKILGLEAEMRPSQHDIDSSPIFALRRVADESWPPSIIGKHWVPYLEQKGHLVDCKPKDFSYKDGWLPLYTRAGVTKHLSGLESLLNKDKTSPLIAVILPEMDFQYEWEYVIHKLHKSESLNRISISYDTNQRKQIAFCPYCGVMNENTATALSHVRKHLRIAFLCGGCYGKIYKKPKFLYNHMLSCQPTIIHRKEKDSQKSEGESQ